MAEAAKGWKQQMSKGGPSGPAAALIQNGYEMGGTDPPISSGRYKIEAVLIGFKAPKKDVYFDGRHGSYD